MNTSVWRLSHRPEVAHELFVLGYRNLLIHGISQRTERLRNPLPKNCPAHTLFEADATTHPLFICPAQGQSLPT